MEYLEFTCYNNDNYDTVYKFQPIGKTAKGQFKVHTTKIVVNELGEDLDGNYPIVETKCSCKAKEIYKKDCKHIIDAIAVLKSRGVNLKYELQTEKGSQ
jgi:hypothetical protein